MKKAILSLMLLASASASAGVINLDDLAGDETEAIANGYQGTQRAMDDFTVPGRIRAP